jgi:hypothetical protein
MKGLESVDEGPERSATVREGNLLDLLPETWRKLDGDGLVSTFAMLGVALGDVSPAWAVALGEVCVCQWPSVSPQLRPSVLPTGGHPFSPLVAMGSPHATRGEATIDAKPSPEGEAEVCRARMLRSEV